jgi:hypothetical protein
MPTTVATVTRPFAQVESPNEAAAQQNKKRKIVVH